MKIKTLLLTALTALLIPALAQAKPEGNKERKGPPRAAQIIKHLDADGDGLISSAEAAEAKGGRLAENFSNIDSDNDGNLTVDELKAAAKARHGEGKCKKDDTE